jgi:acyl-homoserine-lactone acylase
VYWARHELPEYAKAIEELRTKDPRAAKEVKPYLDHLLAWDGRITAASTQAALCQAWYELLYGPGYPGETLRPQFRGDAGAQLRALPRAAEALVDLHGDWRIPFGELFRSQRRTAVADIIDARFSDGGESLPCIGGHGPMGVAFTQYYTPTLVVPLVISQRRRYGLVGASYMAAWEFPSSGVRGASLVPFGVSGDPHSPHYFDQARLMSEQRMKPELFTLEQIQRNAKSCYSPGNERTN